MLHSHKFCSGLRAPSLSELPPALPGPPRQLLVCRQLRRPRGNLTNYTLSSLRHREPTGTWQDPLHMPSTPWSPSPASFGEGLSQRSRSQMACAPGETTATGNKRGSEGFRAPPTTAQCPTVLRSGQEWPEGFKNSAHTCPMLQDFSEWPGAEGAQWPPKPGQCWRFFQKQPAAECYRVFFAEARGQTESGSEGSHYTGPG